MCVVQVLNADDQPLSETVCDDIVIAGNKANILHGGRREELSFATYKRQIENGVPIYGFVVEENNSDKENNSDSESTESTE